MINFILGLIIGGLISIVFMCILQINRINEMQNRINKAIEILKELRLLTPMEYGREEQIDLLIEVLGGDVDDE